MFLVCVAFFVLTGTIGQTDTHADAQLQSMSTPTHCTEGGGCVGCVFAVRSLDSPLVSQSSRCLFVSPSPQASSPRSCSCARSTRRSRSIKRGARPPSLRLSAAVARTAHHSLAHSPSFTCSASATEAALARPSIHFFSAATGLCPAALPCAVRR
jgi:hypothetical protein